MMGIGGNALQVEFFQGHSPPHQIHCPTSAACNATTERLQFYGQGSKVAGVGVDVERSPW